MIPGGTPSAHGVDGRGQVSLVQLDPLAPEPDQWLLETGQLTELGQAEGVVPEHRLPADVTEAVEPDGRGRAGRPGTRPGLHPEGQSGLRGAPPGWSHYAEAGLLQHRSAVPQEVQDAGGVGGLAGRGHFGERRTERGDQTGGSAEAPQKVLVGVVHVAIERGELGAVTPHGGRGDQQARIVHGLEGELDPPLVHGRRARAAP